MNVELTPAQRNAQDPTCTEPNRRACPRLCQDFCNKAEEARAASRDQQQEIEQLARDLISLANSLGFNVEIAPRPLQPLGHAQLRTGGHRVAGARMSTTPVETLAAIMHNVRELRFQSACHTGESTGNLEILEQRIEDAVRTLLGLPVVQPELDIGAAVLCHEEHAS